MANAVKKSITNKVVKLVDEVTDTITLTLSLDEAVTLHDLTRSVGGDEFTTRRKYTAAIGQALAKAGVPHLPWELCAKGTLVYRVSI